MIIPISIGAVWLVAAGLYYVAGAWILAAVSGVLAPVALVLTIRMRKQAATLAAAKYLTAQRAAGLDPKAAMDRIHELAPDGVTIDTDDVPDGSFKLVGLLALGAVGALVHAIVTM